MSIEKWRNGYDGLLAALLQRAKWDLEGTTNITPAQAQRLAARTRGNTIPLDTSRFAVAIGFDSPAQEIKTFLQSEYLRELLMLADCAAVGDRLGLE